MTEGEVAERLRAGGVAFAFDTNALFGAPRLFGVCAAVSQHNERLRLTSLQPIRLTVSAIAHAEKLFDLKQKYRDKFDPDVILEGLRSKGVHVEPFESRHALETAQRLGERYKDTKDWHEAKRLRCVRALGLPTDTKTPGTGKGCGATVDWLIGGHARAARCVLVTDDTGPEFVGLVDRVKLEVLEAALKALLVQRQ